MAKTPKSNTAAIVNRPMGTGESGVSVRKIDNGYLVREYSSNDRTGEYRSSEHFSREMPNVPRLERSEEKSESSLREAIEYMKDC